MIRVAHYAMDIAMDCCWINGWCYGNGLACTSKLNRAGWGSDVHLLHVTPNHPRARHPSIVAFFSIGCGSSTISSFEGKNLGQIFIEAIFHRYASLLSIHDGLSILWIKWWLKIAWVFCFSWVFDWLSILCYDVLCDYCEMLAFWRKVMGVIAL